MGSTRLVFIPGITGMNSGIRCLCDDERFDILDLPRTPLSAEAAKDIAISMSANIRTPFIVVGNSYGSFVAVRLAALLPDICQAVVLVNPPSHDRIMDCFSEYRMAVRELLLNACWAIPGSPKRSLPTKLKDNVHLTTRLESNPDLQKTHRKAVLATLGSLHIVVLRVVEVFFSNIRCLLLGCQRPVLILYSNRVSHHECDLPKTCSIALLPNTDHSPLVSCFRECIEIIDQWANKL